VGIYFFGKQKNFYSYFNKIVETNYRGGEKKEYKPRYQAFSADKVYTRTK